METAAIQDQMPDNHCFGCGPENDRGLRIKSHWSGAQETICRYQPEPYQAAGPRQILNGGIIATLVDCHCICTAVAAAYRREGRAIGSEPRLWYVTGTMTVRYVRPTPLSLPVELHAHLVEEGEKKTILKCLIDSGGQRCAEADVVAVRVPLTWRAGS